MTSARQKKIMKIHELMDRLYCFKADEVNKYKESIKRFNNEGLDKLIKTLEDGIKKQDEFIKKRVMEDKDFSKKISAYLKTKTDLLKKEYEQQEKRESEKILEQLE